jgi:uncharacterized protein (TIGR00369 family)
MFALAAQTFNAADPDFATRVRLSFSRQQAMGLIGAEMTQIEPGFCEIRLKCRPQLTQQHGFVHGGIVGMIADSAGGYAAFSLFPANASILTVEYKMNLLAPGKGDALVARARVIKPGRTLTVVHSDVYAVEGAKEVHCAAMQLTLITLQGKADGPTSAKEEVTT